MKLEFRPGPSIAGKVLCLLALLLMLVLTIPVRARAADTKAGGSVSPSVKSQSQDDKALCLTRVPPTITCPPCNQTNCAGTTCFFSVNASGTGLTYQWYFGTSLLNKKTNCTLTLSNVTSACAGAYTVVVRGSCGSPLTNCARLFLNPETVVTVPPMNSTNCPGTIAYFSVNATGTDLTYQWYYGTNPLSAQTNSTLKLTSVTATNAGTYRVVVRGECGNPITNSAVLVVNANTLVTTPPCNATNCAGTTAYFSVNATGTGLSYQWYQGATPLPGQTNSILILANVSAANAGTYSVVVSGACGNSITKSAVLAVNANTLVTTPPCNATNCPGTTAYFSVNATGTGLSYQWYQGATSLPGQTNSILTLTNVSAANAGTYSVVVSGACGNPITNSAVLVVNANTLVTTPPCNATNCPGTTTYFSVNATGTGLSYQWYQGATPLPGQTNSILTLTNVSAANAGTYSVVVSGVCGNSITNSAVLTVNTNTLVTMPPSNATNCPGTAANFSVNATGSGLSYQWYQGTNALTGQTNALLTLGNVSAENAGAYSVVTMGECGGPFTNSAILVVNQNTSVAALPNVTNLLGSSATFTAVPSGTGPFTFQWYQGGTALIGQTNSTLTLTDLQVSNAGPYCVAATGACGIAAASGFVLAIHLPPVVNITYPTNGQVFVAPATFDILASASDVDGTITNVQFFSSTNGVDFVPLGQTNNAPYLTIASNLPAGSYTLVAEAADNFGATAQSPPVSIEVVPPQPPTVGAIGHLTLNVQDGYQWLSNVVCNPVESYFQAVRVYIHNITNSAIQVVNASGTNGGLPYVESPAAIEPGTCWTNIIMFYDPRQLAFYPALTAELVPPPNAAGNPTGTVVPMLPPTPEMLANGTVLIEFASTNGGVYYVQYSSDDVSWNTSLPAITGSGQEMQWIDSGPPLTASLPAANVTRYYRVILAE